MNENITICSGRRLEEFKDLQVCYIPEDERLLDQIEKFTSILYGISLIDSIADSKGLRVAFKDGEGHMREAEELMEEYEDYIQSLRYQLKDLINERRNINEL